MKALQIPKIQSNEWDRMSFAEGIEKWLNALGNRRHVGEELLELQKSQNIPMSHVLARFPAGRAYLTMEEQRNILRLVREYGKVCRIEGDCYYLLGSELERYNAGDFNMISTVMVYEHSNLDPYGRLL